MSQTRATPSRARRRPGPAWLFALACTSVGCASTDASTNVEASQIHEREPTGVVSQALSPSDPVSSAVTTECSTSAVAALSRQLLDEIQCMQPGTLASFEGKPGFSLGSAVFPFLQTPAVNALLEVQRARGTTMTINSALRTLPQQYLLYRWYRLGRCNISLAATPGNSNHESGLAVDIDDSAGWRTAMTNGGFTWLGAKDPVHYDFKGAGTVDIGGLSVQAFQRLWNRNHPEDRIDEDGKYGTQTEDRIAKSPVGGFALGATCSGDGDAGTSSGDGGPVGPSRDDSLSTTARPTDSDSGCSQTPRRSGVGPGALLFVLALVAARRRASADRAPGHERAAVGLRGRMVKARPQRARRASESAAPRR